MIGIVRSPRTSEPHASYRVVMAELLLGCGSKHQKLVIPEPSRPGWTKLTTLDINGDHGPDVVHDLEALPLPFADNSFSEIHAYEVLEHTGRQGDYRFFFGQFEDFWRILEPGGYVCGSVPNPTSVWAWADPSHSRVIAVESFQFLDQSEYARQVGVTPMSDYRYVYRGDFELAYSEAFEHRVFFALRAIKPSRHQPVAAPSTIIAS